MNESEQRGERKKNSISLYPISLQQSGMGRKKIINAIKCGQINQMPQTLMKIFQGENFLLHIMVSNLILAVKDLGIYLL